jgi:Holliday junction resolvase RusA-like endonuclease
MQPVTIHIAGTPRGKGRPRFVRATGRAYTDAKTAQRENTVAALAALAMCGRDVLTGPVCMDVRVVVGIPKSWPKKKQTAALVGAVLPTGKPDLTNVVKLIEDGLNGIVYADDAQIVAFGELRKVYGPEALTVVTVRPVGVPEDCAPFQTIGAVAQMVVDQAAAKMHGE